jgi:release factor glutamine methyltransferase
MLPTPSTDHVDFERIYEPAEDSYLLLDTLSSESESSFLSERFPPLSPSPLVVEIGTGSGVVLAFITANADDIFHNTSVLTLGVDINVHATRATEQTVAIAQREQNEKHKTPGFYLGNSVGDITTPLRSESVDVLVFNPPYVPSEALPTLPENADVAGLARDVQFDVDSQLLALSYAGGEDGMETTDRVFEEIPRILSKRGVAYVLLCAQNKPDTVKFQIRKWEGGNKWHAETVGSSGKQAGWEKLQIVRVWRA